MQPHPAAEAAAAKVMSQGPHDVPYIVTEDEDQPADYTNGYHAEPLSQSVYGAPPQAGLVRQQTFGKVGLPNSMSELGHMCPYMLQPVPHPHPQPEFCVSWHCKFCFALITFFRNGRYNLTVPHVQPKS